MEVERLSAREFVSRVSDERLRNLAWLLHHPEELSGYGGKWVAVSDQRVCCVRETLEEARREAAQRGLSARDMVVHFVEPFDVIYAVG